MKKMLNGGLILGLLMLGSIALKADTDLYISDNSNRVGVFDLTTDKLTAVLNYGIDIHDLAFTANGNFYATTKTALYRLSTTGPAKATLVSAYPTGWGGSDVNGLVGLGSNLLASSYNSNNLYAVDVSPFSISTLSGNAGLGSEGDITFGPAGSSGPLYDSLTNGDLEAITIAGTTITSTSIVGALHVGSTDITNITGMADIGSVTYAVGGTELYIVDLNTAALTPLFNWAGKGLSTASGAAALPTLSVPEPGNVALLFAGLSVLFFYQSRKRARA